MDQSRRIGHVVSNVDDDAPVTEMAESIVNNSPPMDSSDEEAPVSRSTTGFCRRCGAKAGEFFNAWHRITTTYYLPALVGSYSSLLRTTGHQKAASTGTDLNGCQIQPLACSTCDENLGFQVVDTPPGKHSFRGRDLFKLTRIQLRCESGPHQYVPVEPQVQPSNPSAVENSPDPATAQPTTMEVDSRPHPSMAGPRHHYEQHHEQHHHHHHHHRSFEASRQSLPAPTARSPPAPLAMHAPPQKSPSNPPLASPSPAVKPVHDSQYIQQPPKQSPKEPSMNAASQTREVPPILPHPHLIPHSPAEARPNGQTYPRPPQEVQLDAIERLQTQVSQNSSALVAQNRDLRRYEETQQLEGENLRRELQTQLHHQNVETRRVDDAVTRLQQEMQGVREMLGTLSAQVHAVREMQTHGGAAAPGHPISGQDSALELMAQQMAVMSHKAQEVDTLKITMEIMKNKIQRLEDAAAGAPALPPASQYASPREPSVRPAQSSHAVPYHGTPNQVSQVDIPVPSAQRTQSYHSQGSQSVAMTPDVSSQRVDPSQPQSGGWVAVNAGAKRTHSNGMDSPQDSVGASIGSPKRPKLAPLEPRNAYAVSQSQPSYGHEHMDTDDSDAARMHTHRHTLPSQTTSTGSIPLSTLTSQHSHLIPYGIQDGPSDDSWRPESQRITEVRTPRGRGRGGGPGSRGGRVRKSLAPQYQHPLSAPEWERDDWHSVPDSQINPDGYYTVARSGKGIIRRGSGGGGGTSRGGGPPSSSGRSVSLGLQGVTAGAGIGLPLDPYAHTKKTRTKPIRNADGILIRKDGRPDMRSQSSAANLRKVHAREKEENELSFGYTPTPSGQQHSATMSGAETPSPTGYGSHGQDLSASQKKHNHVMSKIFPGGVDETRKDHDYARKVFEETQGHKAQPRAQHHHHHHHAHKSHSLPLEIKHEQAEESRIADTQSPNGADVDMDRPEDHADDEGQTPGGHSDNSGRESQYHDATEQEPHEPQQEARSEPVPVSASAPQSAMASSDTPAASSVQASGV